MLQYDTFTNGQLYLYRCILVRSFVFTKNYDVLPIILYIFLSLYRENAININLYVYN